ncbi:MAG TPA: hypothetical protein ENK98_00630, partial [Epsilonproteobacteria bacterium]|nr:hypothetical protein [Campylobacterota bacterium]
GLVYAGDIEVNDDKGKDVEVKSSIQMHKNASEADEVKAAKVGIDEVLANVKAKFSGKIIKVELDNEDGNLIYEAEVFQNDGKMLDVVVDAGTGQVLTSSVDKADHEEDDEGEEKED